ncbi:MAG: hypothetical protein HQL64_10915 [Magnetococcales bacterium]|nr:hypothetical protein [Magnetococcales bacterium]
MEKRSWSIGEIRDVMGALLALRRLDPVWEELFPVEQQRLVHLLIARVEVEKGGVKVHLRAEGLDTLARELNDLWNQKEEEAA